MANFKRNVTYFYQFHNGVKGATTGFLKMEIRGDDVKVTVNIQDPYGNSKGKPVFCLYHESGDYLSAVKICEINRQEGALVLQTRTPWREVFDTGRDIYTFDGALVIYSDNEYYLGDFDDRDRSAYEIKIDEIPGALLSFKIAPVNLRTSFFKNNLIVGINNFKG